MAGTKLVRIRESWKASQLAIAHIGGTRRTRSTLRRLPALNFPSVPTGLRASSALLGAAVVAGALGASHPSSLLLVLIGAVVLVALVLRAAARLTVVVAGGLMVLQTSSGMSPAKLAYLAAASLCLLISLSRLPQVLADPAMRPFRRMPWLCGLLATWLLISSTVATSHGYPLGAWFRDALPYALLSVAPILGMDAASEMGSKALTRLVVIFGIVGGLAFAVAWLSRRGVSSLGIDQMLLATAALLIPALSYGYSRVAMGPRRVVWSLLVMLLLGSMLVTGTRTTFAFGAGILGLIGSRHRGRIPPLRAIAVITPAAVGLMALVQTVGPWLSNDQAFLERRYEGAWALVHGGLAADHSAVQRRLAYKYAADTFHQWPLLGSGPGKLYAPVGSDRSLQVFSLDTPLMPLAKFGVFGCAVLLIFLVGIWRAVVASHRAIGYQPVHAASRSAICISLALTPFVPIVEDKGFAFGMMLFLALLGAVHREAVQSSLVLNGSPEVNAMPCQAASQGSGKVAILGVSRGDTPVRV